MEAKVAKTLMEAYASVYNQPEQIDEGITSVVRDPKENKGPAFCRNYALKKSKSNFIAFLDSDDYLFKNKLNFSSI